MGYAFFTYLLHTARSIFETTNKWAPGLGVDDDFVLCLLDF